MELRTHGMYGTASFDVREILGNQEISHEQARRLAEVLVYQLQRLSAWIPNPVNRPNEVYAIHWS